MGWPYIDAGRRFTEIPSLDMFKMHSHDDYELYCFLSGSAKYYIEGSVYKLNSGDILLMKKAESHSLIVDKLVPYERIVINFNDDALIGETAKDIMAFIENRPLGKANKYFAAKNKELNLIFYLDRICRSESLEEKRLYLTFVLNLLCKEYPQQGDGVIDDFKQIVDYINDNLFQNISLETIASEFYLSKNHLNRKFKKYTGSTVWSYIMTKRLIYSRTLIKAGGKPTEVYLKCGFNDYGSFYKAYKHKYGISPQKDKAAKI